MDGPRRSGDETSPRAGSEVLRIDRVSKRFGGTQALADVSMAVGRGEVVALLGENGAGKSTLIKILAGVHTVDSGTIGYEGADMTHAVRRMPISFIHQDLGLIDWMTVAENICLTLGYPRRFGLIDRSGARKRAERALKRIGADIDPELRIQSLTRTEKSLVAIARALATDAEILVLDEPTASLPADEVARLFGALRRLREHGVGMIYVSHRLDEVFEIADRMVVLRDGRVAGERMVASTSPDQTILLIVGREPSLVFRRPAEREGGARLEFASAAIGDVGPIDCRIHAGEIIGLVGLRGAGQEAVSRALFGMESMTGGQIRIDGATVTIDGPRRAMELGVNLVCADRAGESIVAGLTVRENFFLNPLATGHRSSSWLSPARERAAARRLGETVDLRPNDPNLAIELLSGGNQQKVAVGRWLNLKAKIYVFEDPTAGVDVGSKAEIYKLFDVALKGGAAILIVSTDFEEIAKVCHRALVFSRGRIVRELHADDLSISNLLAAGSGQIGHGLATTADTVH
ncbi:MAG: sugar ABC transporter ATP-binding protein [Bradyrhizobium sp.]|uniref:sugar ABC transporter ATP-binding protein n=1 Tax=Bradyrhizobium sp. TaxID=376 RepID=UPI001D5AD63C|nr:sugar ABC transporter ATP-binding protein [Bradyrhizobium sp.]MBV9561252.1 sugar ABC transporter ATP-binding protein [Bradyrhizobium sp.]